MHDIPKFQDANLQGKVVLVRVDHNVIEDQKVQDPFRIDVSIGTLLAIASKGGKLILMTHVGRPKNKKTGAVTLSAKTSVEPIVRYLEKKLFIKFVIPEFIEEPEKGYVGIDTSINTLIRKLRAGEIDGIYLPNIRWFQGEEGSGPRTEKFAAQLAGLADVYVNDAFGSWQAHTSTVRVTEHLSSYAGYLMQHEIEALEGVFNPKRPMVAVVAGSKFDSKIGPLSALLGKVDTLLLGGVIYNAYLCAKYGISISGIEEDDLKIAKGFLEEAKRYPGKVLEPPYILESDTMDGKLEGRYRVQDVRTLKPGAKLGYVLDVSEESFDEAALRDPILGAKSIFVNAVMGYAPHFSEGTKALYSLIDQNKSAHKMFGGGDTLSEFRRILPGTYASALEANDYYFFSGGGTILKAIQEGRVTGLEPVKALIASGAKNR
jgi:phosphoglycerate kinase